MGSFVMIVELLIFSGRPNPKWRPTWQESAQILGRITCEKLVAASLPLNRLGYGGFSIRDFGPGEGDGRTSEIRDGVIAIAVADGIRYWADSAGLERYLLQMGRMHGVFPVGFEPPHYR
jgi:hypothetical protein